MAESKSNPFLRQVSEAESYLQQIREAYEQAGEASNPALRLAVTSLLRVSERLDAMTQEPPHTAELPRRRERAPRPSDTELYSKLVSAEHWADTRYTGTQEGGELYITGDTTLRVSKGELPLRSEQVFVLNHFFMEDAHALGPDFFVWGLASVEGKRRYRAEVKSVLRELSYALGEDMLYSVSNGAAYRLRSSVRVFDERGAVVPEAKAKAAENTIEPAPAAQEITPPPARQIQQLPPSSVSPNRIVPVLQQIVRRQEQKKPPIGRWGDAEDISKETGLPVAIVQAFIERNRAKLGRVFARSERRPKRVGAQEIRATEHFSPQFMDWAKQSLLVAKARYEAKKASDSRPES